jgi:hypothetical protein
MDFLSTCSSLPTKKGLNFMEHLLVVFTLFECDLNKFQKLNIHDPQQWRAVFFVCISVKKKITTESRMHITLQMLMPLT